jgi:hypothetical protein
MNGGGDFWVSGITCPETRLESAPEGNDLYSKSRRMATVIKIHRT